MINLFILYTILGKFHLRKSTFSRCALNFKMFVLSHYKDTLKSITSNKVFEAHGNSVTKHHMVCAVASFFIASFLKKKTFLLIYVFVFYFRAVKEKASSHETARCQSQKQSPLPCMCHLHSVSSSSEAPQG